MMAKTRTAPIKRVTIPRLELCAAVLLAQLTKYVLTTLALQDAAVHLWTDSTIVLTWINSDSSRWKEFVGNRVALIHELTPRATWRHISGAENPADLASRGSTPDELRNACQWWTGPSWLTHARNTWPTSTDINITQGDLEERSVASHHVHQESKNPEWDLVLRYSSLTRLLRVTALLNRAAKRFQRQHAATGPLSPDEIEAASRFWCKLTQSAHFSAELKILNRNLVLARSHAMRNLLPFVDNEGLIRVGGRLQTTQWSWESQHPIVLTRNSTLTTLLIHKAHCQTYHGGAQLTLATLRRKHWIIGGRSPVRLFILKCVRCARFRARPANQIMSPLPACRTTPSRPFLHAGVDYAGPFKVKSWRGRGSRTYKAYLVVFVCFATSAAHLELATDYSTEGFLAAYRRFTGRRGLCATLRSDCGTNFVGADAELRRLFTAHTRATTDLSHSLASIGTKWIFNPPSAPNFGGKWEAVVKSVKYHIRRVIGTSILTYEEFTTFLAQVEAILNSRPLEPVTDDTTDLSVITPGHFLIGDALQAVPEPTLEDVPLSRLKRWQLIQRYTETLWKQWTKSYLQSLQSVMKWRSPSGRIKEGDIVILRDERHPPLRWPLGRIVKCHPGPDGRDRVFLVKTQTGELIRPITKLCLLPV